MNLSTEHKIKQYHNLNELARNAKLRADELKEQIKAELSEGKYQYGDIEVQVQVKDRTTLDEKEVFELCFERPSLYTQVVREEWVVKPEYVEEAYLAGDLDDHDLRRIRKPQYSVALTTKKVLPDANVQSSR